MLKATARERREMAQEWSHISGIGSGVANSSVPSQRRPMSCAAGHAFPDPKEYAEKIRSRPHTSQHYFQMAIGGERKKSAVSYDLRKKVHSIRQELAACKREHAQAQRVR